jgi:hypothetical protein
MFEARSPPFDAACDGLQGPIRKRPLQARRFLGRRGHPGPDFLGRSQLTRMAFGCSAFGSCEMPFLAWRTFRTDFVSLASCRIDQNILFQWA